MQQAEAFLPSAVTAAVDIVLFLFWRSATRLPCPTGSRVVGACCASGRCPLPYSLVAQQTRGRPSGDGISRTFLELSRYDIELVYGRV